MMSSLDYSEVRHHAPWANLRSVSPWAFAVTIPRREIKEQRSAVHLVFWIFLHTGRPRTELIRHSCLIEIKRPSLGKEMTVECLCITRNVL